MEEATRWEVGTMCSYFKSIMKISIQRYPEQRGRLILAGRSVATQPLAHSLTAESGRNQKCKSRIKSWVEIQSLTSEEKKKKINKSCKSHHSPSTDQYLPRLWATATLEKNFSSPPRHPWFYCWTWHYMVWNISLVSLDQPSWLCPIPTSGQPHPTPGAGQGGHTKKQ